MENNGPKNWLPFLDIKVKIDNGKIIYSWFQKDLHCSPAKHYLDLRLQHAYHLLNNSRKSVTEIAMAAGFTNTAYFSLAFKKKFGTSPRSTRLSK